MRLNRSCIVLVLWCLLLGSCREADEEGASPIPYESYCDRYADVTCTAAERCDCLMGYGRDLCVSFMESECRGELEDQIESGRSAYQPSAGGQCLQQLAAILSDCRIDLFDEWPAACDEIVIGLGEANDPCDDDDECRAPLECLGERCTTIPGRDDPCFDAAICADDLYCGSDDHCHPYHGRGESCAEGSSICADDLYCDSRSMTCEPYLAAGADCSHASWACDDDLYCSGASGTCRAYPRAGESCADSYGICVDGAYCDADEVCERQRGDGAACTDDEQCLSYDCVDEVCEGDDDDDDSICPF